MTLSCNHTSIGLTAIFVIASLSTAFPQLATNVNTRSLGDSTHIDKRIRRSNNEILRRVERTSQNASRTILSQSIFWNGERIADELRVPYRSLSVLIATNVFLILEDVNGNQKFDVITIEGHSPFNIHEAYTICEHGAIYPVPDSVYNAIESDDPNIVYDKQKERIRKLINGVGEGTSLKPAIESDGAVEIREEPATDDD